MTSYTAACETRTGRAVARAVIEQGSGARGCAVDLDAADTATIAVALDSERAARLLARIARRDDSCTSPSEADAAIAWLLIANGRRVRSLARHATADRSAASAYAAAVLTIDPREEKAGDHVDYRARIFYAALRDLTAGTRRRPVEIPAAELPQAVAPDPADLDPWLDAAVLIDAAETAGHITSTDAATLRAVHVRATRAPLRAVADAIGWHPDRLESAHRRAVVRLRSAVHADPCHYRHALTRQTAEPSSSETGGGARRVTPENVPLWATLAA